MRGFSRRPSSQSKKARSVRGLETRRELPNFCNRAAVSNRQPRGRDPSAQHSAKTPKAILSQFIQKALKGPARTPIAAPNTPDVTPGIALHGRPVPTAPAGLQLRER